MHSEMITIGKQVNISITFHSYFFFFFIVRAPKSHPLGKIFNIGYNTINKSPPVH